MIHRRVLPVYVLFIFSVISCEASRIPRDIVLEKRCVLPEHPINGRWSLESSNPSPGDNVTSGTIIHVRCNGQYTLNGSSVVECNNGKWKHEIGKCLELSPHFYDNADVDRNPLKFQPIPTRTPVCGQPPTSKFYPWNVAIFEDNNGTQNYICSGTLINEKTVLTVAHCVTNDLGEKRNISLFTIAVGKASAEYNDRHDKEAQYAELQDIFIPDDFKGRTGKYHNNFAVLITREPFNITQRIQPACVDWSNEYQDFENPKVETWVASPLIRTYLQSLENFTQIKIALVNESQCYSQLTPLSIGHVKYEDYYVPNDMYCSGYVNSDQIPSCLVDQGVGLVSRNRFNDKYYVIGVLNLFPSIHGPDCDNKRWILFNRVSKYKDFITEKINSTNDQTYFQKGCGIKSVEATIGRNVTKGDYPWHSAIYKLKGTTKELICGGSLINQRVILTAAHCVTDSKGELLPKDQYVVAVGKYYKKFDDSRDVDAQFSSLKHIFVSKVYRGEVQNYNGDIALLVTENSFDLTGYVQPVCVDWDDRYETQFLQSSVTGYVSEWGYTQDNQESEKLKELEAPYIERELCEKNVSSDYDIYLTYDKMCAGFLNKRRNRCGTSGGGLVFKNTKDERYYLAGIASVFPASPTGACNGQQYAFYTKVSKYVTNFIKEKAQLYWGSKMGL